MQRVKQFIEDNIHYFVILGTVAICAIFLIAGSPNAEGYITINGGEATITDETKEWIESAQEALNRIMNEDKPTDAATIAENDEDATGQGFYTTIEDILGRVLPDGNNDGGNGWQCSRYTGWLATGKWSYSSAHPDYGPVNGNKIAEWLVNNYGFKYIDTPVKGAIGSGGFNTTYGHTVLYLYSTGGNKAMVNDANWKPLTVYTHEMDITGYKWVVPGNYEPTPTPTPTPTPSPSNPDTPVASSCDKWTLVRGDTLGHIMLTCEGYVEYGEAMNAYARTWYDPLTNMTVYEGWNSPTGVGLHAGHTILKK